MHISDIIGSWFKFQFHGLFSAKHRSGVGLVSLDSKKKTIVCWVSISKDREGGAIRTCKDAKHPPVGPDASSPRIEEGEKVQGLRSPRLLKSPWWTLFGGGAPPVHTVHSWNWECNVWICPDLRSIEVPKLLCIYIYIYIHIFQQLRRWLFPHNSINQAGEKLPFHVTLDEAQAQRCFPTLLVR